VAIVDPEWHLAGVAGDDRRPVDGAIARTMVELGRRPVRTAFLPSGGWHIECANDIAFRARLVEPARAERIARLAALAAGVPLAPLVACRDGVVVERWISGPSFEEAIDDPSLAERVGRLFGGLSASAAGHREFRPWRRPVEPLLVDLDARLARLVANGDLDGAVAERLAARARSNAPDRVSAGLVHVDDRPSSVVCAPDGPVLVGNHHLEVGLTDRHLARIWGRWPMASAARNRFLRGYGSVRSTRPFLLHELFWAIDTLVAAAADSEGEILRRHIAALEVLAAGELPSDWRSPPANDRDAPVRVAFLCDWLSIGGQERNALETIRGLDRRRFSPFLYAFLGGSMEPSFRALGIPMVIGSDRDPGETRDWNAAAMIESKIYRGNLGSCLARDRIDAAVVFGYRHAAWALQAAGVPVAIERLDGPNLIDHVSDKGRFDRVVAQSVTLRDLTAIRAGELGIEAERVEVVFPGVDLARFDPSRVDRDAARASLGFGDDELVIGTVGRLIPGKNIGSLVEAFAALPTPDLRDRSRLLVVGPDLGELARLIASAASLGVADRVVFVPGTDDVPRHLAAMDLFVMTSRSEGVPSALLEAMAMGLPAVTTGCGSIPEVIDGNALVLDDAEPGRLARAIARLLARPGLRRAMGGRARSIAARFAVRHAVGRYEAMILECLRAKGYPPSHESAH
jgi:glycosyltransferase involved in cell wall biosynthesis